MNFHDDSPSILIDSFKDHPVLTFDLTSMQDATKNIITQYTGEPMRLELIFSLPLHRFLNSLFWGNECLWLQFTSLGLLEKSSNLDIVSLQPIIKCIPLRKYRYFDSVPSDFAPTLDNDIFVILKKLTQYYEGWSSNIDCKFLQVVVKTCMLQTLLDLKSRVFSSKWCLEHYGPIESLRLPTIYTAFQFFKFGKKEIAGVQDVDVFLF